MRMHGLPGYEFALWLLNITASLILAARLWTTGLRSIYRFLFAIAMWNVLGAGLLFARFNSTWYVFSFFLFEFIGLLLSLLIILELYSVVLRDYPALAQAARRFTKWAMGIAVALSLAFRFIEIPPKSVLDVFYLFDRAVVTSLLFFALSLAAFLVYFPVPLHRNAFVYGFGYAVWYSAKASLLLLRNAGEGPGIRALSAMALAVETGCILYWALALRPTGEAGRITVGHRWNRGDQEQMLVHLRSVNAALSRTVRK